MVLIPNSHLSLKSWSINLLISVQPKQMNKHAEYNTDMLMVRFFFIVFPLMTEGTEIKKYLNTSK